MDFQTLVDLYQTITCILSVERTDDGRYGEIRIVAANQKFQDWLAEYENATGKSIEFRLGMPYDEMLPKDLNFEDQCYRSAIQKKPVHTYFHPLRSNHWINIFAMPIAYEEGSCCYCTYTMEQSALADIDLMSTNYVETSADVLKTCIKLYDNDTSDFEITVKEIIHDLRVICDAAVCTLMLMNFDDGTCSVLATSIKEGSILKRATQFTNFYDIALSWLDTIGDSGCLIIKDEKDMQYISQVNNPWYLTLEEAGVDSVVMLPLRYHQEVFGYIWATNFDTRNTMRIKETLELSTFFLSSAIVVYKTFKSLEHISYTDMLTGVKNRNAMNNRVSSIVDGSEPLAPPYGIVFADLNGLKCVNDHNGHSAGDLLLKKAAITLQEVFTGDEIYRAGGDEFMIISVGGTKEELCRKVDKLHQLSENPDSVSFATGYYYDDIGGDIRSAMRQADEKMYKDKDAYYTRHPERKYR